MNYGEILSTTWKIFWKHKVILGFGLLGMLIPALLVFLMGGYFAFSTPQGLENNFDFFFRSNLFTVIFLGVILLVNLLSLVFSALGNAGVFKGTLQAESGADRLAFSELWETSWPYVARILGLMLLIGAGSMLVFVFPALLGMVTAGLAFLCIPPMMIILIPLGIMIYLIVSLGMAAIVGDNLGVFAALPWAWELLKRKFWPLVLMTMILYLGQMLAGTIISLPMTFVQMFLFIPMASGNFDETFIFRGFGILMAVFMPLTFLVQGLSMAFVNSAWMVTYLRVSRQPSLDLNNPLQLETS